MNKTVKIQSPRGLLRFLYRIPIQLYRIHLGWLLGKRFLLLSHQGRKSGITRRTALEVVKYDQEKQEYTVVSAYGKKSDWYRNILKTPQVTMQTGRHVFSASAHPLEPEQTFHVFQDYNRRYPGMIFSLSRMVGYQVERSEDGLRDLAEKMIAVKIDHLDPIK
jgi:deazaflavin-dependent oxidoreductase (nitroreductase family)